jgi:hypothetical protein
MFRAGAQEQLAKAKISGTAELTLSGKHQLAAQLTN